MIGHVQLYVQSLHLKSTVVYVDIMYIIDYVLLQLVTILPAHENLQMRVIDLAIIAKRQQYWTRSSKMSHVCLLFLKRGSSITCLITGT